MTRQAQISELVSTEGVKVMVKVGIVALAVVAFVYGQARYKLTHLLQEEAERAEREAERALAAQPVPPPADCDEADCECGFCTGELNFEEWITDRYCEQQGWGLELREIRELDVYYDEDWEPVS